MELKTSIARDLHVAESKEKYDAQIKIIINLEAQKDSEPGYELVTRALYYCARMISAQHGREFDRSGYDKIKKVYSIWICTVPSSAKENAIVEFVVDKKDVFHSVDIAKSAYDKIDIIMLYLTKDYKKESEYIIEMLSTLLTDRLNAEAKTKLLQDEYGIPMTTELGKGVLSMCNLSEGVYEKGVQEGIQETLADLVRDKIISATDAAKRLGISEKEFMKLLEK